MVEFVLKKKKEIMDVLYMNICHSQGPKLQLKNSEFNVYLNVTSSVSNF